MSAPIDWPANLGDWNAKSFNTPQFCKWGDACVYNGCCGFVHPGEEGTGLKYFPARSYTDGVEIWEPAVVRLIGTREKPVRFYERRRLRLSWPQWCARVGMPAPIPLSQRKKAEEAKAKAKIQEIGEKLYLKIDAKLAAEKQAMINAGLWNPSITTGKLTGMLVEAYSYEDLLNLDKEDLSQEHNQLYEACAEACQLLHAASIQ